jgi:hypothetical protein
MRRELFIGLFLTVATLVVFWQVGNHAFIHVDDSEYVTDNVHVNTGLSWDNLTWAFTSTHTTN